MRSGGGAAILLGAAVGATAALALRENTASPPALPALGAPPPSARGNSAPSAPARAASVTRAQASALPLVLTPSGVSAGAPAPAASSALRLAPALPPVTTVAELERAEIHCYDAAPEECGRAADAYDLGELVPRDSERAARLRKIELTRLVRQCEKRSPHACLVLAGRYASGQGVPESEPHARGLLEHARDLCAHGATKLECTGSEPK